MKILLASDLYWPAVNGVATFSRNLVHSLIAQGHEVQVIAPSPTRRPYLDMSDGYPIVRTRSINAPLYDLQIALRPGRTIAQLLAQFQPDVIHVQTPLQIGRLCLLAGRRRQIPVIATNHSMPENLLDNLKVLQPLKYPVDKILRIYGLHFHNRADLVTVPTKSSIQVLARDKSLAPDVVVVSNGIDTQRFAPTQRDHKLQRQLGLTTKTPTVLFVGRLDGEKHLHILIQALALIQPKLAVRGLLVGRGNQQTELKTLTRQLNLERQITFAGFVADQLLPAVYRLADCFAIPSPAELQSIATLEAAASGLPIVAANAAALPELCHNGKNGYLFPLDDAAAMAEAIIKIVSSAERRLAMGNVSRQIAEQHSLDRTVATYERIYRQAIKNVRRRTTLTT